jgi:phage recombination protein Bet
MATDLATTTTTKPALPEAVTRRSITEAQWRTLMNSLYPGAKGESVLMVWDYCLARHLDPLKKPCHIVPMEVKIGERYEWRDVVMPGIYEHRTTAQRTGQYLGHSKPEYGESIDIKGTRAPEWCAMTFYRWNAFAGQRVEYPVTVFFREVVATKRDGTPNQRWQKAPIQMLTKCTEAAGLREAFPDEIGGETTAEEMDGQRAIDSPLKAEPALPRPDDYEPFLQTLTAAADQGEQAFALAWKAATVDQRAYLAATEPEVLAALRSRAEGIIEATATTREPGGDE